MSDELHIAGASTPVQQTAAAWFARLRADDVSEHDRSEFQCWLDRNPENRAAYERMESLWSYTEDIAGCPEIETALRTAHVPPSQLHVSSHRFRPMRVWAAAAVLALVVLAGGWAAWKTWGLQQAPTLTYATAIGQQRTVTLADGSRITLDTDTRLSVRFSSSKRHVMLERGRAFFRVAKDTNRPFLVVVGNGVVRDIGTQFGVYKHHGDVDVTLVEGRVAVTWNRDDAGPNARPEVTNMEAGQKLLMGRSYPQPVLEPVNANATAWLSGKLVFNDTPLPEAVAEFNRYSTDKIAIGDPATALLHVSGVFRSDNSQAFVNALHAAYGVVVTRNATDALVLSSANAGTHPR